LAEGSPTGWVDLTFTRITRSENPGAKTIIRAHVDDEMSYYVLVAAKKLGFRPGQKIVITTPMGSWFVEIEGRTVGEVIRKYRTTHFNITTPDDFGR